MNNKKICFITCVNDVGIYNECLEYINALTVPVGFEIETLQVNEAKSITSGYNKAMKESDAKYKVYLHQDVFIINKNFIQNILEIYNSDNEIGMIGVVGAKTIPISARLSDSTHKFGKIYESRTGKMELLKFEDVQQKYIDVKVVDGSIMVTQYDVAWREDIFKGWHFYDISQCTEFLLRGHKVVIPNQDEPWCMHDCEIIEMTGDYDKNRAFFLDEYYDKVFPLVSVLIPAYNKREFLEIGLKSVLNQTYKNIEIIICDDSTNDEVENMVKSYISKHSNIKYRRNIKEKEDIFLKEDNDELRNSEGNNNAVKNFDKCLRLSSGEYINYLMDDDLFREDKISTMMNYYIENEEITLVTSYRQLIDKNGKNLKPILATEKLSDTTVILEGKVLMDFMLESMLNSIGEPTSVLFKKKDLDGKMFGEFNGKRYYCNIDISTWMSLLSKGKAVYIPEPLSSMRVHDEQRTNMLSVQILGTIEWFNLIMSSIELGYLKEDLREDMMYKLLKRNMYLFDLIVEDEVTSNLPLKELYDCYDNAFKDILHIGVKI